ncbi:MAG TPA: hypothetical protein VF911_21625, partial [Thermoanaerobaculia bacterium]
MLTHAFSRPTPPAGQTSISANDLQELCNGVTAGADDAPPAAKPLDDAALASLGIDPGDVETNDGSWSWTSGAYSYDGSGNIKAIGTQSYVYDVRGRLVNATMTRPDQPGSQVHTYSYDAAGNM